MTNDIERRDEWLCASKKEANWMRIMRRLTTKPHRVKNLRGGRGSGKSWMVAEALIQLAVRYDLRFLCLRRVQKSIDASAHQLLCDTIRRLGYESDFTVTNNSIKAKSGAQFRFLGFQSNLDSIKSIEGVDICWVEEAHAISPEAWEALTPTMRRPGAELWITFNPAYAWDETYVRFVLNAGEQWFVEEVNWYHNPHFGETLDKERLHCLKHYPDRYDNIWNGVPVSDLPGSVVNRGNLERLIVKPDSDLAKACRTGVKTAVLDVADDGDDDSVLSFFDGRFLYRMERLQARDTVQLAQQALKLATEEGCSVLIYDSVGVGSGVKGELNKYEDSDIEFRKFVAQGEVLRKKSRYRGGRSNEDTFHNLRAQAWWAYRDVVNDTVRWLDGGIKPQDGIFAISNNIPRRYLDRILSDSTGVMWETTPDDKILIESKKKVKKRLGVSTDYADAIFPHLVRMKSGIIE
ncbi:TPA: PBSX family phage terminase large subunit [Citrobacter freundii]|uniref:Terminase n=1 Tax=Citrobacter freundii TaxID=546 RepID=A0AA40NN40_CITFR|nr:MULTISPECIES: PBSX family phage terminase large subunit [Citrobacter freundii complex]ECI7075884.1 PBSX family phage terminase large subunit [Salmonella enterica subsp. enterica]EKW8511434.1 PBSX family phage terminase large subunit [Citrobacter freundii]KPR56806.1 terminase [Citrobacter freundii]MDT7259849.1 PBSX family phage terminase large subunit [Citrobacter freundii]MDT7480533.1 PBSX family phage terminase large subunit [Citrobacter portucalensis]